MTTQSQSFPQQVEIAAVVASRRPMKEKHYEENDNRQCCHSRPGNRPHARSVSNG